MSSLNVPSYVITANNMSTSAWNLASTLGSTVIAFGIGAFVGIGEIPDGKPATWALQLAVSDLFWKYVVPRTAQQVFMHERSNFEARIIGVGLSYVASLAIPYVSSKYLIPLISENIPHLGQLKKEETAVPFKISHAFALSLTSLVVHSVEFVLKRD
jgi:hypothetical protein